MLSLYGFLDKAIGKGRLTVEDAKGVTREFGGKEPGPEAAIRFTSSTAALKILINPELNSATAPITPNYIEAEEARIAERGKEFLERVVASAQKALNA
ncbi:hypothetical protein [Hoeflea alexandrii]|jgi:cyclopropane-fatty-acyl-phospholipid synthase